MTVVVSLWDFEKTGDNNFTLRMHQRRRRQPDHGMVYTVRKRRPSPHVRDVKPPLKNMP